MPEFICTACGTAFPPADAPPAACPICTEERQYVPAVGQGWTTPAGLAAGHRNALRQYEPGVIGIGTEPAFAIGQRALLIRTDAGNVLWDCISLVDEATVSLVNGLGGLAAIAVSHPHFYTSMGAWSRAFGGVPVHLHGADRNFVVSPDPAIHFWEGETLALLPGVTLIRCGGHFDGASVLHWSGGAAGKGIVCAGDTLMVTADRKFVSFMKSYPNLIPLSRRRVEAIAAALAPYDFDRVYGLAWDRVIGADGKAVLARSVARYVKAIGD